MQILIIHGDSDHTCRCWRPDSEIYKDMIYRTLQGVYSFYILTLFAYLLDYN